MLSPYSVRTRGGKIIGAATVSDLRDTGSSVVVATTGGSVEHLDVAVLATGACQDPDLAVVSLMRMSGGSCPESQAGLNGPDADAERLSDGQLHSWALSHCDGPGVVEGVDRCGGHHGVDTGALGHPSLLDHAGSGEVDAADHHRHPPGGGLDDRVGDSAPLVVGEVGDLAGGAEREQAVDPAVDEVVDQPGQRSAGRAQ